MIKTETIAVEVRNKATGNVLETIQRKPFNKGWFGNFVPVYVRYQRQVHLLQGGWDYAYMHGEPTEAYIEI